MARLCAARSTQEYVNTDTPTRTQTEEAFGKMFGEMMGDFQRLISAIGLAVVVSLVLRRGQRHGDGACASGRPRSPSSRRSASARA